MYLIVLIYFILFDIFIYVGLFWDAFQKHGCLNKPANSYLYFRQGRKNRQQSKLDDPKVPNIFNTVVS